MDWPFALGPVKVVPYATGRVSAWETTVDRSVDATGFEIGDTTVSNPVNVNSEGGDIWRLLGGGGVRAAMPLHRVFADVQSRTWDLNKLRHIINFDMDLMGVATSDDAQELFLYDQLDDDATRRTRQKRDAAA